MNTEASQTIPVERGWPLLGILPNLISGGDPFEYLKSIMLKQGDFVQLNIGTQPVYLVSNPDYLQRILRDNYLNYRKPDMFYNAIKDVARNGLATNSGASWLRQRRMIQPHLHRKQLVNVFAEMVNSIAEVLDQWEPLAKNAVEIDLGEKMGVISSNVTIHTLFGRGLLPETQVAEMGKCVVRLIKYIGETVYSSFLPGWVPIPGRKQFDEDRLATKKTVQQIIEKCRQEKEISASLIQMLINSVDEEDHQAMTEDQLYDEVMTIFVGGYETTATVLTWLGVIIQNYPEVLEKLHAEIADVLGSRTPIFEDIPRLTYTRKVFMEILRMHTVIPFLPRALNKADQLGNYRLPENALMLVFYHGVHHNPNVWENPEVFDPERFTPERMAKQHPFAYVPFSAGPRKCAGDEFVLMEGPLIMAMMLQKYNFNILPNQTFEARIGATMHPRNGVKGTFSLRTFA